ncbi:hypothetical protein FNV43_RR15164 [Rhamnella rubrinervis]|uniref:Annexin n=1 Tax=Rhamnella rubrinervis TaxID=2594499 RepID=A0A8K0GWZ3_9ROSA|nr:hypothetical protein FNV43_RR15164 [Rhamnella rubrinervis]
MAMKMLTMSRNSGFENECKEIHDSWGRLSQLVRALVTRTRLERQQIRETYKALYGEDLVNRLQKEAEMSSSNNRNEAFVVSPKLCAALSMFMLEPHERDAVVARRLFNKVIRPTTRLLWRFSWVENPAKSSSPNKHIKQDTEGSWTKILPILSLPIHTKREGSYISGVIEEAVVLEILSKRSIPQMKLTISSYKHIYGHDYTKSLKKGNSGEFENALKRLVKCIHNPPNYYAKTLHGSMKGTTTDKGGLLRLLVSRAEVEMDEIRKAYKNKYGIELRDAICESIPSGDYRDFLVALATK